MASMIREWEREREQERLGLFLFFWVGNGKRFFI